MNEIKIGYRIKNALEISQLITISKQSFSGGYFFKGESHDSYELVCVLDGAVGITADKKVFVLSKGQMTIHKPLEFHAIWEYGGSRPTCIIISFTATIFPKIKSHIYTLSEELLSNIDDIYEISKKIFHIIPQARHTVNTETVDFDYGSVVSGVCDGMQLTASRFAKELELFILAALAIPTEAHSDDSASENYAKILQITEEHIDEKLNMTELARLCGMSVPLVEKTMYKYLRCGVMTYYNNIRMNKAYRHLAGGESVKNTALMLGFSNQNYFSFRFKKHFGYAPTEIKKQIL